MHDVWTLINISWISIISIGLFWSRKFFRFTITFWRKNKIVVLVLENSFYFSRQLSVISISMPCLKYDCAFGGRLCGRVCVCNIQSFVELFRFILQHKVMYCAIYSTEQKFSLDPVLCVCVNLVHGKNHSVVLTFKVFVSTWTLHIKVSHVNLHGSRYSKV